MDNITSCYNLVSPVSSCDRPLLLVQGSQEVVQVPLLTISSTSATVSGSFTPRVSGSSTARHPPAIAAPPNIRNGSELFLTPRPEAAISSFSFVSASVHVQRRAMQVCSLVPQIDFNR